MKKEELIEKIEQLPDGIDICLFDHRMNMHDDGGDGSTKGIYPEFDIEVIKLDGEEAEYYKEREGKEFKPWAALSFINEDYEE